VAPTVMREAFLKTWTALRIAAAKVGVSLVRAAAMNLQKIASRWPAELLYIPLFDESFPVTEQLPRDLDVNFRGQSDGSRTLVSLHSNGVSVGDTLTDNIRDPDGYRYHDIFHLSFAAHLGWSPVLRSLLHRKRKSNAFIDETEDGARAAIIEESLSAIIFNRAKDSDFFRGVRLLDYDLLKTIHQLVSGFEVERAPLWQWEVAILEGYRVFRKLFTNRGGRVHVRLDRRELVYSTGTSQDSKEVVVRRAVR